MIATYRSRRVGCASGWIPTAATDPGGGIDGGRPRQPPMLTPGDRGGELLGGFHDRHRTRVAAGSCWSQPSMGAAAGRRREGGQPVAAAARWCAAEATRTTSPPAVRAAAAAWR